jgi:hypothetical protein
MPSGSAFTPELLSTLVAKLIEEKAFLASLPFSSAPTRLFVRIFLAAAASRFAPPIMTQTNGQAALMQEGKSVPCVLDNKVWQSLDASYPLNDPHSGKKLVRPAGCSLGPSSGNFAC